MSPTQPFRSNHEDTALRDSLAVDRTVLANERTLLAYIRTSLAFAILGASLLQFMKEAWYHVAGIISIALAAALLAIGTWRFLRVRRRLAGL